MPEDQKEDQKDDEKKENANAIYQAVTLGMLFPVAIGVGYFGGRWLDGLLHTRPWLAIIGTVLGAAAAFVNLFRAGETDGKSSDGSG
jgi:F0F1-type ATP synthase assembly protein I